MLGNELDVEGCDLHRSCPQTSLDTYLPTTRRYLFPPCAQHTQSLNGWMEGTGGHVRGQTTVGLG